MNALDRAQTKKRPSPGAIKGDWWRFSSYRIREGSIVPAEGAKLEWYDPWPAFHQTRHETVGQAPDAVQPAYQSLMKLVRELVYEPGTRRYPDCLTQNSLRSILAWCQQHGPLGVLLARWEAVTLPPQKESPKRWMQRKYFRGFGQVIQTQEVSSDTKGVKASVLIHGLNDLTLVEEVPSKTWGRFFPSVRLFERDTFFYPPPYTDDFAWLYAERVGDFCNAAKLLAGAMQHLGRPTAKTGPDLAQEQSLDTINLFCQPVASVVEFDPNQRLAPRREAPSLLASFAEMFVQDQAYGRRLLVCVSCGTPFVSNAYQALYCKRNCRLLEQKRRLRRQMKTAKSLRSQGQSLRQIAAAVGQPVATVKGWLAKEGVRSRRGPSPVR